MKLEINIKKMLPFLGKKELYELAQKISDHNDSINEIRLDDVIPFMSNTSLVMLARQRQREGKDIRMFYPFLPSSFYHEVIQDYIDGKEIDIDLNKAYPFMANDDLHLLLQYAINHQDISESQENPENDSQIVGTDISETIE